MASVRANIGENQPYMQEPQSDPDSDKEQLADASEWLRVV